jgi:hypothetical protein
VQFLTNALEAFSCEHKEFSYHRLGIHWSPTILRVNGRFCSRVGLALDNLRAVQDELWIIVVDDFVIFALAGWLQKGLRICVLRSWKLLGRDGINRTPEYTAEISAARFSETRVEITSKKFGRIHAKDQIRMVSLRLQKRLSRYDIEAIHNKKEKRKRRERNIRRKNGTASAWVSVGFQSPDPNGKLNLISCISAVSSHLPTTYQTPESTVSQSGPTIVTLSRLKRANALLPRRQNKSSGDHHGANSLHDRVRVEHR